ncbi:hypothetical protein O9992_21985 [Vibrio lentus]|nr:hypothetical protein [Vibrio lentus]
MPHAINLLHWLQSCIKQKPDLYNAISVLESQYAQVTDFITQLNTATNGIGL